MPWWSTTRSERDSPVEGTGTPANGQANGQAFGFGAQAANGFATGANNGYLNGQTFGTNANGYTNAYANGWENWYGTNAQTAATLPQWGNWNWNWWTGANGYGLPAGFPKVAPIAIIGMSCRLPGNISSPVEFWELLARARGGWAEARKERFASSNIQQQGPSEGVGGKAAFSGCYLNSDIREFDAPFFSMTEKEATELDPQQRVFLECAFEALENAGIPKQQIVGKDVGVFTGATYPEYEATLSRENDTVPKYQASGKLRHIGGRAWLSASKTNSSLKL
jgi:hypothetical protein